MNIRDLYNLIEQNLDNDICSKNGKMKRVKLPIPEEFGGGVVTGEGYMHAVRNLIDRITPKILEKEQISSPLFSECWESWIRLKEGQNRSPSTIAAYKYLAEKHLLPFFEGKRITDITPDDIQLYFNSIEYLSKSVSNQSKAILSGIFDRAVRMGHVPQNIMLYKYERSRREGKKVVLQDEDLIRVISQLEELKGTEDIRDYLYFCFLCFTSLRRGEILGLRWGDLDFKKDEISVRNNVTFPNGVNSPLIGQPKDGSFGTVHLNSELKRRIEKYQGKFSEYVIPYSKKEPARPMTKSMFVKLWRRCTNIINLSGATSHSFRSSYATMMNAHCSHIDPKALQSALRHKTPDLAIKVYTKENISKTREAEKEYDEWLKEKLAQ